MTLSLRHQLLAKFRKRGAELPRRHTFSLHRPLLSARLIFSGVVLSGVVLNSTLN